MRILFITNLYPPAYLGGYELECKQVVEGLRDRGHDVHVLTSDWGEFLGEEFQVERKLHIIPPFPKGPQVGRIQRSKDTHFNRGVTEQSIERVRPDHIYLWSQLRLSAGSLQAAEASGIRVSYRLGDDHLCGYAVEPWQWSFRKMVRFVLDRWVFPELTLYKQRLSRASYVSKLLYKRMSQQGVSVDQVEVIHRGIPIDNFPFVPEREGFDQKPRLLYVGQLHYHKGVHEVLEALTGFDLDLSFSIAGTGDPDYLTYLKRSAASKDLDVNFLGKMEYQDLKHVYADHDVFVFPSIWEEPQGATYLEAMACGLPVLATLGGGQDEILEDGVNAYTYQKFNHKHFRDQLIRIIEDSQTRQQICKRARADIEQRLSLDRYIELTEKWLQSDM